MRCPCGCRNIDRPNSPESSRHPDNAYRPATRNNRHIRVTALRDISVENGGDEELGRAGGRDWASWWEWVSARRGGSAAEWLTQQPAARWRGSWGGTGGLAARVRLE